MKCLNITIGYFAYGMAIGLKKAKSAFSWLDFYHETSYNIEADFEDEGYQLQMNESDTFWSL